MKNLKESIKEVLSESNVQSMVRDASNAKFNKVLDLRDKLEKEQNKQVEILAKKIGDYLIINELYNWLLVEKDFTEREFKNHIKLKNRKSGVDNDDSRNTVIRELVQEIRNYIDRI